MKWSVVFICVLLLSGCANKGYFPPTQLDLERAAYDAVTHPGTWVPLAGAGVVALGDWDESVSDWAREETPVYGSRRNASRASNVLRASARWSMIGSALLIYDSDKGYWAPMVERQLVQHAAAYSSIVARRPIKSALGRERPNGKPEGLPSGHATRTFATIGSSYQNMEDSNFSDTTQLIFNSTQVSLGIATSWARIEGGHHYPTDVLAGAALGNVVSVFINSLFLEPAMSPDNAVQASFGVTVGEMNSVGVSLAF